MPRPPITACVITRDEARHIGACLESVAFCEEVVVVDSGSTDRTVELAREAGARVVVEPWRGFVGQKRFCAELASHDWLLSIDADERITPELRDAIERALAAPEPGFVACSFPRRARYLGRWMRHGAWYPNRQLRLFRRSQGEWTGDQLHEHVEVQGRVQRLDADLLHLPFRDLAHHLQTIDRYTSLAAEEKRRRGAKMLPLQLTLRGPWEFFRSYVLRRGFLDGWPGFVCAVMGSYYSFLKYAKLWEMSRAGAGDEAAP